MDVYQDPSQRRYEAHLDKRHLDCGDDESPSKRLRRSSDESTSDRSTPHAWERTLGAGTSSPGNEGETCLTVNYEIYDRRNGGDNDMTSSSNLDQMFETDGNFVMGGEDHIGGTDESVEKSICYGALCETKLCLVGTKEVLIPFDHRRYRQFEIIPFGRNFSLCDSDGKMFAVLDLVTCQALRSLDGIPGVVKKACIEVGKLRQGKSKKVRGKGTFPLSVNIYGPLASADRVGTRLFEGTMFLQIPYFLEPGWKYFNPQLFRPRGEMQNLTHLVGLTDDDFNAMAIANAIGHVLDSLNSMEHGSGQSQDICTDGLQPDVIKTQLRSHQLDALAFLLRREDHDFCQRSQNSLRRITGIQDNIPSYGTGGILADSMGLGKTLTTIASIAATLEHARQHTSNQLDAMVDNTMQQSRGTLVVVSSMQVLDVWKTEITNHVKPGALKTCVFHGNSRLRFPEFIADHDIVLTTYATLIADDKSDKVLRQVQWYRVVLDEAHWIRNQASKQFKAAKRLASARRWCLTGTPIQNGIDDLVSLLDFLHFEPFAKKHIFERHILEPLSRDTPDRAFRLQMLLSTICLRRTEKLLHLPEPRYEQITLALCSEEMSLYREIGRKCARDIDDTVSATRKNIKKYNILFKAIMSLRRLCNHGTFPVPASRSGSSALTSAADLIFDCDFCQGLNEDVLELANMGEVCVQCGRNLDLATRKRNASAAFENDNAAVDAFGLSAMVDSGVPGPQTFSSTKLKAVVNTIDNLPEDSKSLVFSYWTATLDLLEYHLQDKGIHYLKIDGRVDFNQRLDIQRQFRESKVPVLLMSIQTGALGINLTAANYVHIVEPQWNPSVEEQAIARAVRMGQTRSVTIFRYVVEKSVEENIISLQKRKRNLAKFTLDSRPGDGSNDSLDDLKFMLDFGSI